VSLFRGMGECVLGFPVGSMTSLEDGEPGLLASDEGPDGARIDYVLSPPP